MAHDPAATITPPSAAALFEAHMQAELHADLEATMATMVDDPHLLNLASGTGGEGAAGVREFYATKLIGQFFPPDVEFISISRTSRWMRTTVSRSQTATTFASGSADCLAKSIASSASGEG